MSSKRPRSGSAGPKKTFAGKTGRDDKKSGGYKSDSKERKYDRKDDGYGDKKRGSSYGDRDKKYGDKKSGGYKSDSKERKYDRKYDGYSDKKRSSSYGDRDKKYGDKKSGGYKSDSKEHKYDRKDDGYGDKKRSSSYGDRDKKYGDKKSGGYKSDSKERKYDRKDDGYGDKKRSSSYGDTEKKGGKSFGSKKFTPDYDRKPGGFKKKSDSDWDDRKKSGSSYGDDKKTYRSKKYIPDDFEEGTMLEDDLDEAVNRVEKKRSFDKKKGEYEKMIKKSEKNFGRSEKKDDGTIRLNKYLANSGVSSRRDADKLIESGAVTVNGVVVTQLGTRVKLTDKVQYGGQSVKTEKLVYILLNKPKDYITTMDDPQGRKTVMGLIRGAAKERVYPVGRLDRNTTGVILFTNDGELTRRLTHPKFLVSKMYHVTLDKNFSKDHLDQMRNGLELEDGYIKPDQLEYSGETKKELGIEIHSGRNRIVRRMFEHLGYDVVKLDRVQFAGLNKKDITRGKWRFLNEKEVGFLKML